jgi:alpha-tubulin suppressor-like RCC1 family protein
MLAGCLPDPKTGCRTSDDCVHDRVCWAGTCQARRPDAGLDTDIDSLELGDSTADLVEAPISEVSKDGAVGTKVPDATLDFAPDAQVDSPIDGSYGGPEPDASPGVLSPDLAPEVAAPDTRAPVPDLTVEMVDAPVDGTEGDAVSTFADQRPFQDGAIDLPWESIPDSPPADVQEDVGAASPPDSRIANTDRGFMVADRTEDYPGPRLGEDAPNDGGVDGPQLDSSAVLLENGTACRADTDCHSEHCVAGVCCNDACTESCKACNLSGKEGQCSVLPLGRPCSGEAICVNETSSSEPVSCDGAGGCTITQTTTCSPDKVCNLNTDGRCGAPHFVQVDVGYLNTCAVRSDGALYCWGDNTFGQLGRSESGPVLVPTRFPGVSHVRGVAVGYLHICVLRDDGQVDCWGYNGYRALGCETATLEAQHCTPLAAGSGAVEIGSANTHTCVRLANGGVKCWGRGDFGQLGDNKGSPSSATPVSAVGINSAKGLSVGMWHVAVLLDDARVKIWGNNDYGQLGNGSLELARIPIPVEGLPGPAAQLGGTGCTHTCVLVQDWSLWCFGDNRSGQIGPTAPNPSLTPVQVIAAGGNVRAVTTGADFTCVRTVESGVRCWGHNSLGNLGNGTFEDSAEPVAVQLPAGTSIRSVVAEYGHACALDEGGRIWCWGDNHTGQLGDGTTDTLGFPVEVVQHVD